MVRPHAAPIQKIKSIARSMADAMFFDKEPHHVSQTVRELKDAYKVDLQVKTKGGISNMSFSLHVPKAYLDDPQWKRKWILLTLMQDPVPDWCRRSGDDTEKAYRIGCDQVWAVSIGRAAAYHREAEPYEDPTGAVHVSVVYVLAGRRKRRGYHTSFPKSWLCVENWKPLWMEQLMKQYAHTWPDWLTWYTSQLECLV